MYMSNILPILINLYFGINNLTITQMHGEITIKRTTKLIRPFRHRPRLFQNRSLPLLFRKFSITFIFTFR